MKKLIIFSFIQFFCTTSILAHEVRPAFLKITQIEAEQYNVIWKVPTLNNLIPSIYPIYPKGFNTNELSKDLNAGAAITNYTATFSGSLSGQKITIDKLNQTLIDVILVVELLDGTVHSLIIQADKPNVIIPKTPSFMEVIKNYTFLGLEHIWQGIDHLLFVLCLLLLITGFSKLIKTITAFTIAHSITLALSTLEIIKLSGPPVEAIIALSIVFLAREYLQSLNGKESLTAQSPWIVAFTFGLLHGFGFAGALSDIGLPQQQILPSLLFFNIGIELGQILFVILVLLIFKFFKNFSFTSFKTSRSILAYGIGSIASFWLIDRLLNF